MAAKREIPKLIELTLEDLRYGQDHDIFSAVDLVKAYLARIGEVDGVVHSDVELDPTAIQQAEQLDRERRQGKHRGPLHGVPLLLKNQFATVGNNNTSGFTGLMGARTALDASVVAKLKDRWCVFLGKTNLSHWSCNRDPEAGDGWCGHGGQTYGVYIPEQSSKGSSSGSGSATALGLAFAALGTEAGSAAKASAASSY